MSVVHLSDAVTIIHGDCLEVLPTLEVVDAVIADPPYNIGKAAWDKIPDYLDWCESWIAASSKGCKRQGAFWCFHSEPDVLVDLSRMIAKHGRPRQNWVTWDKDKWTYCRKYKEAGSRRFIESCEYIVYHADDGQWTAQSDECRGFIFEPLRAYLVAERDSAGLTTRGVAEAFQKKTGSRTVTGMASHWFGRMQWELPTSDNYEWLRHLFNSAGGDFLRREYEHLRREYEHLRPTFNNPGKVSSVWQYPPAKANGHATPKPVELMQRIIETTTNPGDMVLDCFMGSGTTGIACICTGRRFIGIERDEAYFNVAKDRLERELAQGRLF